MKALIASTGALALLACALASSGSSGASNSTRGVTGVGARTLVTIPSRVAGFAQNGRYVAWIRAPRDRFSCGRLDIQDLRTGRRVSIRRGCSAAAFDPGSLVLARDRAYWEMTGSSNLTEFADLLTASMSDRAARSLAFQSIYNAGFDHRVPPVSDGRSVYFWTSPEDATPGPLVRFDGTRRQAITPTISRLSTLAAGEGRYAYARAHWTFDCAREPAWSPNGKAIAFASADEVKKDCRGGLWIMGTSGAGARRIATRGRNPDWSPDGSKLAFDDGDGVIIVTDAAGGGAHTVARGAEPSWSPDGLRLAFTRGQAIFVAAADGSNERLVASGGVDPDWSPDGARLVFARTDKNNPGLAIIGVDGTGARSLTSTEDRDPTWSPDGRTIAYTHCSLGTGLGCASQVFVIAPDGTGRRSRTPADAEAVELEPSWAPDSRRLVFARAREWQDEGDSHLFTLSGRLTRTPRPKTPIVIRSRTGRLLRNIDPGGEAVALAVSSGATAAVIRGANVRRLEIYSPRRRTLRLGRSNASVSLTASGRRLAVGIGSSIFLVDTRSSRLTWVARASAPPIGLSIVGRRIAWAENHGRRARVRALTVP
jgi:Tol biopolymer transport system component